MDAHPKTRIAVFASGNGGNFQALADACAAGEINGEIVALVTNNRHAYAVSRARALNIEPLVFDPSKFTSRTIMCAKTSKALQERDAQLICLAGYMVKIEACLIRGFPNRILNIHPSLLPAHGGKGMYGRRVHEAVLEARETETGCTIHVVDEQYDHGPVVAQARIPVRDGDTPETLAERLHPEEHKLYVSVVRDVCAGRIDLDSYTRSHA